jgi:4-diphosphocytidyl-2-C-methyl-D-erythritol kinase
LKKQIPAGAGLGGGSSDAAGTLLLLNALLSLALSADELRLLAVNVGADVPFFLQAGLCMVEGVGELLTPFPSRCRRWYVLLKPSFAVDTSWAYKKLNYKLTNKKYNINMRQFFEPDGGEKNYSLFNAFEDVIFAEFQLLSEMKQWLLKRQGVRGALMSGSGSAMYAVFSDRESAVQAFAEAETRWGDSDCLVFLAHNLL